MEPFKIFMSYARHDNSLPPDLPKAKGFVTFLDEQLAYELRSLGEPVPQIWRDTRFIERGNQFDPLIQEGIESSGILVVVLSRNWLHRPYCLAELERFEQCWRARGETPARIFKRIVLVSKHSIDPSTLMPLLQGQQGYEFFAGEAGREHEFFARGEICDPAYRDRVRELASYLWRTAADLTTKPGQQTPSPKSRAKPIAAATPASGRTIYVAKPAKDMRQSYFRLVEELQGRGHIVVPGTAEEIPTDATAGNFVRTALESAELSIHLLGEGAGYQPEQGEPIVKLQLSRAAVRASTAADNDGAPGNRFHRIIWAPKAMEVERVQEDGSVHAQMLTERDPLKVLAGFNQQLATDEIVGDNLSKFVEFLVQGLDRTAPTESLTDSPATARDRFMSTTARKTRNMRSAWPRRCNNERRSRCCRRWRAMPASAMRCIGNISASATRWFCAGPTLRRSGPRRPPENCATGSRLDGTRSFPAVDLSPDRRGVKASRCFFNSLRPAKSTLLLI